MTARGTVRIMGLLLVLALAGSAAAQAPPADPVAVLDAMMAQSAKADAAPDAAPDSEALPDIISGVIVQAPPVHKRPPLPGDYSWSWNYIDNGQILSLQFGLTPNIGGTPIIWQQSGRDIKITIPRSANWEGAGENNDNVAAAPEHTVNGTAPYTDTHWSPFEVTYTGHLSKDRDSMVLVAECSGCSIAARMAMFHSMLFQRWGDADPPGPAQTPLVADETRISIDAGRGVLAGTYRDPPDAPEGPAVLIVPGAGPVNSNGDSMLSGPGPSNLRLIAEALDKAGYRSLRYDKRGIGDSSRGVIPKAGLKITDLVSDTADWARYLAGQPKVTCVVLLGHSEGAMVAMLAAQKIKICGLISLSGPGQTMAATIQNQLEHADLSKSVKAQFKTILTSLQAGKPVASVPTEMTGLQPEAQPFLMSQLNIDPASVIQTVKAPVLIIQGDNDLQVSVADAQRLAAARPDAQLLIVKFMNNATKSAPSIRQDNIARSLELNAPLAKPVMPAVIAFLEQVRQ